MQVSEVALTLQKEFDRLMHADPFQVFGLGYDATAQEARACFLIATKQYHPSRYARMDRYVVRLANEVFLRFKEAYGQLADDTARAKLVAKLAPESAEPEPRAPAGNNPAEAIPEPVVQRPSRPARAARPAAPARGARPARTIGRQRPARPSASGSTIPTTRRPSAGSKSGGVPIQGPGSSTASSIGAALQDTVRKRSEQFERSLKLTREGRFHEARSLLQQVAAADPKTRKYRVHMHYAWGLEHEDAGRIDDARAEFQRAINCDPQFKRAHEAMDRLPGAGKKGIFSKLFGR